jgi:CheY-like chemotaxis protein
VSSVPGQGSTFSLRLYLSETGEPAVVREARHRPVSGYIGERRTLLVVDDQAVQRQLLAGILLPLGFRLREAASGEECLESVEEAVPDAILLDISMDGMDGWETARRLRARGLQVPIVFVSANAFENQPERVAAAGCQGFVDKPVAENELLDTLERVLELEWVSEIATPSWAPETASRRALQLPPEHAGTLLRLARIGHRQGLLRALELMTREYPQSADAAAELRALAESFDWNTLVSLLGACLEYGAEHDKEGSA